MCRLVILVVAIVLGSATSALSQEVNERFLEYELLTIGKPSGQQNAYYAKDGRVIITFSFNDGGRGPETRTIVKLNEAGVPVALHIKGKNYEKAEVDERFSIIYGKAVWASKIEHQQADFGGRAFYVANNAPPELLAILARAVLAREDRALPLLPSGTARIRSLASETLEGDKAEATVSLYAITGLGPDPKYIWLDQDQDLFAGDDDRFAIIRKNWAAHLPALKTAQTKTGGVRD